MAAGYTLIELLATMALVMILAGVAVPTGLSQVEEHRIDSAARYVSGLCFTARAEAVKRAAFVAIRFQPDASSGDFTLQMFVDGNRNGVRSRDITNGIDPPISRSTRLVDRMPGTQFGVLAGVTGISPGDTLSGGDDPIQIGRTDLLSFNPDGSATSGTVYLRSDHLQRAVRVLGATGRTRLLAFWFPERRWIDQ